MVEGEGFEPSKAEPADLQSAPFDRSGTPPAISTAETRDCSSFGGSRSNVTAAVVRPAGRPDVPMKSASYRGPPGDVAPQGTVPLWAAALAVGDTFSDTG